MKHRKIVVLSIALAAAVLAAWGWATCMVSNPWNARQLGDIPCPRGFQRTSEGDASYNAFLRALPLKERGAKVRLHTGGKARLQWLSAGVIDWTTLSNSAQCADVAIRIRAEHLWNEGRLDEIRFTGVDGKEYPYKEGLIREHFESYLKTAYGTCNTSSVYKETRPRPVKDVRPGDVLVYPSRRKGAYGHAVLVADVARDRKGRTAVLCVEGNTPARDAHVVRSFNPFRNPWHLVKEGEDIRVSVFRFHPDELRHY